MSDLRIGIDLTGLAPDPAAGAAHALTEALRVLARERAAGRLPGLEPVLLGPADLVSAAPELAGLASRTTPVPTGSAVVRAGLARTWLRHQVTTLGLDALHHAGGPPAVGVPGVSRVVSIDDLAPIEQPGAVGPVAAALARRVVPAAVAGADAVVVPSPFLRDRLVTRFGAPAERIHVVPWPLPAHGEAAPIDTVRAVTGIIGRFVLLPAPTHAHEEQVVAVRAMRYLASRHPETTLVLLGEPGRAETRLRAEIAEAGLDHCVVRLHDVRESVRVALVEHAAAVVHPAVYGGAAEVVLEAMASGVPVVVADAGAAVDLVRGAAAVVPPGDAAQLAVELHRILEDEEWRGRMVADGTARAATFTAERTAEGLVAAYSSLRALR